MRQKYAILISAALLFFPSALIAQDGQNQTVVVTNKFSFESSSSEKHQLEMALPDSLNVFEKSFSYRVFDKPYAGAYEFHPYNLKLEPVSSLDADRQFWMNLGIGYNLFPEFDLVYEPVRGPRFSFGLYARHRSYLGDYRRVGVDAQGLLAQLYDEQGHRAYFGDWNYDFGNEGGLNFSYDWNKTGLSFNVGYNGLQQRDWLSARSFDKAAADLKIYSKRQSSRVFNYAFLLSYQFGRDYMTAAFGRSELFEHNAKFGFSFNANMKQKGHFALAAGAEVAIFSNAMSHTAGIVEFRPQYVWERGNWFAKVGLRVDIPFDANNPDSSENKSRSQWVYPEIQLSYEFKKIPLNVYLNVTGGEKLRSYSGLVNEFRHFSLVSRCDPSTAISDDLLNFRHPVLKNEVERVNAEFGLRGSIRSVFSYNLSVSYSETASLALESLSFGNYLLRGAESAENVPCYSVAYADSGRLRARAEAEYSDDWGSVGLKLLYTDLYLRKSVPDSYVLPAALAGNLDVKFNLMKRLFFGVGCEFATPREVHCSSSPVTQFKLPAYGDPYLSAEYRINQMLSVRIEASRFTGQTIYSSPVYSERGPRVIAGLSLSF